MKTGPKAKKLFLYSTQKSMIIVMLINVKIHTFISMISIKSLISQHLIFINEQLKSYAQLR